MKKLQLLEILQDMPEEFSVDELMERLLVLQKIEEGQQQIQAGKFYTEAEAKSQLFTAIPASPNLSKSIELAEKHGLSKRAWMI